MTVPWDVVGTFAAGAFAGGVTLIVKRWDRKDSKSDAAQQAVAAAEERTNKFIGQLQQQYKDDRLEWARERARMLAEFTKERDSLQGRQARTEARVEGLEGRERVLLDYTYLLRSKVPPPPPPWPAEFGVSDD